MYIYKRLNFGVKLFVVKISIMLLILFFHRYFASGIMDWWHRAGLYFKQRSRKCARRGVELDSFRA